MAVEDKSEFNLALKVVVEPKLTQKSAIRNKAEDLILFG